MWRSLQILTFPSQVPWSSDQIPALQHIAQYTCHAGINLKLPKRWHRTLATRRYVFPFFAVARSENLSLRVCTIYNNNDTNDLLSSSPPSPTSSPPHPRSPAAPSTWRRNPCLSLSLPPLPPKQNQEKAHRKKKSSNLSSNSKDPRSSSAPQTATPARPTRRNPTRTRSRRRRRGRRRTERLQR